MDGAASRQQLRLKFGAFFFFGGGGGEFWVWGLGGEGEFWVWGLGGEGGRGSGNFILSEGLVGVSSGGSTILFETLRLGCTNVCSLYPKP